MPNTQESLDQTIKTKLQELLLLSKRQVPEFGKFDPVSVTFEHGDIAAHIGKITLRIGPFEAPNQSFDSQNKRYLDFVASTPSGKSQTSQYLKVDSRDQIEQFLSSPESADKVKTYIQSTIRDFQEYGAG